MYRGEPKNTTHPVLDLDFNSSLSDSESTQIHTRSRTKSAYTISPPRSSSTANSSIPLNSPIRKPGESHHPIQSTHSASGLIHSASLMNSCVSIPLRTSRPGNHPNAGKPHLLASRPPRWTDEEVSRRNNATSFDLLGSLILLLIYILNAFLICVPPG